jgi:hypothetical protein
MDQLTEVKEQPAACCGGPAPDACCVTDAEAKAVGQSGCGCGDAKQKTSCCA